MALKINLCVENERGRTLATINKINVEYETFGDFALYIRAGVNMNYGTIFQELFICVYIYVLNIIVRAHMLYFIL